MITSSWPQLTQYANHLRMGFRPTSRHLGVETRLEPMGSSNSRGARGSRTPLSQPASAPMGQLQAHHRNAEKVKFVRGPISSELKKAPAKRPLPFLLSGAPRWWNNLLRFGCLFVEKTQLLSYGVEGRT
jgi:hypothetical protein